MHHHTLWTLLLVVDGHTILVCLQSIVDQTLRSGHVEIPHFLDTETTPQNIQQPKINMKLISFSIEKVNGHISTRFTYRISLCIHSQYYSKLSWLYQIFENFWSWMHLYLIQFFTIWQISANVFYRHKCTKEPWHCEDANGHNPSFYSGK